jgi:lariat debranching enzyme
MSEQQRDIAVRVTNGSNKPSVQVVQESAGSPAVSVSSTGLGLNPDAETFEPKESSTTINSYETAPQSVVLPSEPPAQTAESEIPEEIRAQLAALSSNFTKPEQIEVSPSLPFPAEISNKTTNFLALGKCEAYQEFLQLMEIKPITNSEMTIEGPLGLSYDPEWLAIQRVFAPELALGGSPNDKVATHRGDTYYRDRVIDELAWIAKHVVEAGKLAIPENFSLTAPIYDPELHVGVKEMPREVTNPQTAAYCQLIGIENKFDITEEERDWRVQQGPRPDSAYQQNRKQNHGQGRGGGGGGGSRGGRRGGGRGRGRGRGGGR